MQGVFIGSQRPKSKAELKRALVENPASIVVEATSVFGNEFEGFADDMPEGTKVHFVGPDPYTSRKFYGTLERTSKGLVIR